MNKKGLKYIQNIFSINSFVLGGTLPLCFGDKLFLWMEGHRFLGFRNPHPSFRTTNVFQRVLVTKGFQCGSFWWPKVSKLQCLGDQKSGGLSRCPGVLILAPMSGRWVGWDKGTLVFTSPWCCMVLLRNVCCTVLQARGSVLNVNSDLLSHSSLSHCTVMVF